MIQDQQYRAVVDGAVRFSNGGGIAVEGFRLDLPSADPTSTELEQLLVAALGLLMADEVEIASSEVIAEQHKGTRGGPSDAADQTVPDGRLVELSHVITDGMVTLPNLPGPEIGVHLTREASKSTYAPGTTFEIGRISMVANTGTYVDAPLHRFDGGDDLSEMPLTKLANLPAVVVRVAGSAVRGIGVESLAASDVAGRAVLLHTGDDAHFGAPAYVADATFLTRAGAELLVKQGAILVGIDAANIDDMSDGERPAHTALLRAGIPIVEHLTGLEQLPPTGARFTAVPPKIAGMGTFPVRAFAVLSDLTE